MALEVEEGGSEGGEQRQEDQPEAVAAAHRRCDGGQSAATELARDPGPKPQNEVSLESFLGLFIDPILLTNIWSDIYGGVGRWGRGSSDQRSGVCHIFSPAQRGTEWNLPF